MLIDETRTVEGADTSLFQLLVGTTAHWNPDDRGVVGCVPSQRLAVTARHAPLYASVRRDVNDDSIDSAATTTLRARDESRALHGARNRRNTAALSGRTP